MSRKANEFSQDESDPHLIAIEALADPSNGSNNLVYINLSYGELSSTSLSYLLARSNISPFNPKGGCPRIVSTDFWAGS